MVKVSYLIIALSIFSACVRDSGTTDNTWPQFRGDHSSGIAHENAHPPIQFGQDKNLLWKVASPEGHSSPCIWENNIFLTGYLQDNKELQTICINRNTGNVNWIQSIYPEKIEGYHAISNAATSTPATDGQRVYVYFGSYGLLCYDISGNLIWERQIPVTDIWYGASSSPAITQDLVILSHDFQNDSYLLALDKATGNPVWKVMLPEVKKDHYNSSSYSTPLVMNDEVILHRAMEISSYSINDGSRLWWLPISTSGVSSPIFYQNTVYIGAWQEFGEKERRLDIPDFESMLLNYDRNGDHLISAEEIPEDMILMARPEITDIEGTTVTLAEFLGWYDQNMDGAVDRDEWVETTEYLFTFYGESGLLALRPDENEDLQVSQVLWKETEELAEVPTPIYYNGFVYMIKNGGILTCLEAESGKLRYRERLGVPGAYLASPIAASGNIYFSSNTGTITVIKATDQLEILAENDLGEKIFSTPAIIGNALYVRTSENLYAFGD